MKPWPESWDDPRENEGEGCRAQKLRFGADQPIPKLGWMAVRPTSSKSL
jgi:hypothetical protein